MSDRTRRAADASTREWRLAWHLVYRAIRFDDNPGPTIQAALDQWSPPPSDIAISLLGLIQNGDLVRPAGKPNRRVRHPWQHLVEDSILRFMDGSEGASGWTRWIQDDEAAARVEAARRYGVEDLDGLCDETRLNSRPATAYTFALALATLEHRHAVEQIGRQPTMPTVEALLKSARRRWKQTARYFQ